MNVPSSDDDVRSSGKGLARLGETNLNFIIPQLWYLVAEFDNELPFHQFCL